MVLGLVEIILKLATGKGHAMVSVVQQKEWPTKLYDVRRMSSLQPGEELLRFGSNMPFVFLLHSYMSNFRQNPFVLEDD
jgi:hypothetical protein